MSTASNLGTLIDAGYTKIERPNADLVRALRDAGDVSSTTFSLWRGPRTASPGYYTRRSALVLVDGADGRVLYTCIDALRLRGFLAGWIAAKCR